MAKYLPLYLLLLVNLATAFVTALNQTCLDDTSIVLQFGIYQNTCPEAEQIVNFWVQRAVSEDPRMAASLLRLHFHDCFGCDASVLLDDTANGFVGEKTAAPNLNSLRGFEVIDNIKSDIEIFCPETVSCADILAIAARDSVVLSGGPNWEVLMGRKDSMTASLLAANNSIPAPTSDVATLVSMFQNVGLTLNDMVALSGAHTIGRARCATFRTRLNGPDINLDFFESLQQLCFDPNSNDTLAQLDLVTPSTFDNQYYVNLLSGEGLLQSDQALVSGNEQTRDIVQTYAMNPDAFYADFKRSMLRMGSLTKLTGQNGEIRRNCRLVNHV